MEEANATPPAAVTGVGVWQIVAIISVVVIIVVALLAIRKYRSNKKRARTSQ